MARKIQTKKNVLLRQTSYFKNGLLKSLLTKIFNVRRNISLRFDRSSFDYAYVNPVRAYSNKRDTDQCLDLKYMGDNRWE